MLAYTVCRYIFFGTLSKYWYYFWYIWLILRMAYFILTIQTFVFGAWTDALIIKEVLPYHVPHTHWCYAVQCSGRSAALTHSLLRSVRKDIPILPLVTMRNHMNCEVDAPRFIMSLRWLIEEIYLIIKYILWLRGIETNIHWQIVLLPWWHPAIAQYI